MGDALLVGLLALDLPGDSLLTTSSFSIEKNPCFLTIFHDSDKESRVAGNDDK
jgi:hypothetical protein